MTERQTRKSQREAKPPIETKVDRLERARKVRSAAADVLNDIDALLTDEKNFSKNIAHLDDVFVE